jgi:hypothetical protein
MNKETGLEEMYRTVLSAALEELQKAVKTMLANTAPETPFPAPKVFRVTKNISWPDKEAGHTSFSRMRYDDGFVRVVYSLYEPKWLIQKIIKDSGRQPAKILKVVEAIEASTTWCQKRRIGRLKAAENLLQQQEVALEKLQRRVVAK